MDDRDHHSLLPDIPPIHGIDLGPTDAPSDPAAEVRVLTQEEIYTLIPDFIERGATDLPDPSSSFFVGAVEGDKISFLCVQLKIHAQPFLLRPGHEHLFRSIIHAAEDTIKQRLAGKHYVYLFVPPDDKQLQGLARAAGMLREPWDVMSKGIECNVVPAPPPETESEVIQ